MAGCSLFEEKIAGNQDFRIKQIEEVPKEYCSKETPESSPLYFLYCVLIMPYDDFLDKDEFLYKVGYTKNFERRINGLGTEFSCDHKIIPVMITFINDESIENKIHRILQTENGGRLVPPDYIREKKIGGALSGEVYYARPATYDLIKVLFEGNSYDSEIWESQDYILDDYCHHTFKGWTIDEYFWDNFMHLDYLTSAYYEFAYLDDEKDVVDLTHS